MVIAKVKKEGKDYGEEIKISSLEDIEEILCRVAGASVLAGDEKVEVELSENDKVFVLEGYSEIKRKLKEYEFLKKIFNL